MDAFGNLQTVLVLLTAEEIKLYCIENDVIDPISVILKAVEVIGSRTNFKSVDMIRSIFRELTKSEPTKETDVVPFIGDTSHDMVRPLLEFLDEETGLNVWHEWSQPDLFLGKRPHEVYKDILPKARCVLILTDTITREDYTNDWYTLEALVGEQSIRPILVHTEPLSGAWAEMPRIQHCPRLPLEKLDSEAAKQSFLENFPRAVFENIHVETDAEEEEG